MRRIRYISRGLAILSLGLGVVSVSEAQTPCGSLTPSIEGPAFDPENVCASYPPKQVGPVTNAAMQDPDRVAWQIFTDLNTPVSPGSPVPFWRSWPEQAEVFPANPKPKQPPQWSVISGVEEFFRGRPSLQHVQRGDAAPFVAGAKSNPCAALNTAQSEEVRINQDAFKYIVDNDLWYIQGKAARFKSGEVINFPTTAREVKANWIPISSKDKTRYVWTMDSKGNLWGLVAMHFLSKEIPNWVWATFEHASNPCYSKFLQAQDSFGLTSNGQPSPALLAMFKKGGLDVGVYSNYRLDGAQVTFTDSEGRPIILGNSVTEFGFQTTASCMTCHARATTDASGSKSLSVFDSNNQSYHGVPDPNWYYSSFHPLTRTFMQTDFMWSLAFCPNAVGTTTQNCSLPPVDH